MKITIPYRRSYIVHGIVYGISAAVLLAAAIFLFRIGTPAAAGCALISLLLLLFPLWMFLNMVIRLALKTGCFSITSDGLEDISYPFSIGCFKFPVTIRLIPWSCIDSFRIDRAAGGNRLLLIAKDQAEFPRDYSPFVRSLLEREQNKCIYGLQFDSQTAAMDSEELFHLLQQNLSDYRRRGYPAGWPEAVPPVAQEQQKTDNPLGSDFI